MPAPKKKKRRGNPGKPPGERGGAVTVYLTGPTLARLLRVFGNESAGGRISLNRLTEDEMVELKNRGE